MTDLERPPELEPVCVGLVDGRAVRDAVVDVHDLKIRRRPAQSERPLNHYAHNESTRQHLCTVNRSEPTESRSALVPMDR